MKDRIYKILPNVFQNLLIYIYNKRAYKIRYGGDYKKFRKERLNNRSLTYQELLDYQKERYAKLIDFAIAHSPYYKEILSEIDEVQDIKNISKIPILSKELLRKNIKRIAAETNQKLEKDKTGGTTGKSLEVYNFPENSQERFAFLDDFRSRFGYELGKRTAWFSGKTLLTDRDIKKNRFWKTDPIHHVRYYSTFHIKEEYLKYYVEDLIKFQPGYFVGFPSSILEIARFGLRNNYDFPEGIVKAIFPTAEKVTAETRQTLETFFHTKVYDQYASSEGAPFIFECVNRKLHLELQSGVFEVLNENDQPASSGRLVVTSFTNEGTPLIRYDIEDSIVLEDENVHCDCGNHNPLVKEILGRIDDYVYSPETGKINLGNISNTLKDTKGIIQFQVIQDELNEINILVVRDDRDYNQKVEEKFIHNWRERVGNKMKIEINYVNEIPTEASGKFRIVKNHIKHLI